MTNLLLKIAFLACMIVAPGMVISQIQQIEVVQKQDDSDSIYSVYEIFRNVSYHEFSLELEAYDANMDLYKKQRLGCHFMVNGHRINISEILKDVVYEVNWNIDPVAYYIRFCGREYLIVSIAFYSGNSSLPPEFKFGINPANNTIVRIAN